jgi:hypothetical protein
MEALNNSDAQSPSLSNNSTVGAGFYNSRPHNNVDPVTEEPGNFIACHFWPS